MKFVSFAVFVLSFCLTVYFFENLPEEEIPVETAPVEEAPVPLKKEPEDDSDAITGEII